MTLSFREARREDVAEILTLLRDDTYGKERETGPDEVYLAAWDRMADEAANMIIVGTQAGRIVATCQLAFLSGLSHRGARRAQVESVRVATDLRGQGIGRALMAEAERRARAAGCRMLQLTTHAGRNRAQTFYDGLGYVPSHVGYKLMLD